MLCRNSRSLLAVTALLTALWIGSPALAAPLPVQHPSSQPTQPTAALDNLLGWLADLLDRLVTPPAEPEVPTERRDPMDSTKPIDDGGNRGGTIDPNGGGSSGIEHMVVFF